MKSWFRRVSGLAVLALTLVSSFLPAAAVRAQNERLDLSAFLHARAGEIIVRYKDGRHSTLAYASTVDAARAMNAYRQHRDVLAVQPNFLYSAAAFVTDPLASSQTHLEVIEAYDAWDVASDSSDVVVAVIDSGVDTKHEDLRNNIWSNPKEIVNGRDDDSNGFVDDINGWDFIENNNDVSPKWVKGMPENTIGIQHGTGVAGIIGATGDNNMGVAGITWDVQIMSLRVLNEYGLGDSDAVTSALRYAVANGADIINLSLVGTDLDPLAMNALEDASDKGIIVVAAAGNNGINLNVEKTYPVCYEDLGASTVIGVGAIDADFNRPSFSNYGSDCVDIVAPGVKIFTTRYVQPSFVNKDEYAALFSGTSFAAPQVTGVVALMKGMYPALTAKQALYALQQGSTRIDPSAHVVASGFAYALNAAGALAVVRSGDLGEGEPIITQPPIIAIAPEFLAYPRGPYIGTAYRYQFPGPILVSPVVFTEDALKQGMRVTRESKNRLLVSAWKPNSKFLWRHNMQTNEFGLVLSVPLDNEQTIGHAALGNVDFDSAPEIIVAAGPQSKPLVSIYTSSGSLMFQFMAYGPEVTGGLDVALVDVNNDGLMEIVTVPVAQTSGHIKIFDYTGLTLAEWDAYAPNFQLGATISLADIDKDMRPEIIVGPGQGGGPHAKVFNLEGSLEHEFFAGEVGESSGAMVDFFDIDGDQMAEYVVSYHAGHQSIIRTYSVSGVFQQEHGVFDPTFTGAIGIVTF